MNIRSQAIGALGNLGAKALPAVPGLEACKGFDVCQQEWSAAYTIKQAAKAAKRS